MYFSENLQKLRNSKNMTQEELAEKLDVSRQAVSKWESGSGYPETEKIVMICEIFDCSMDSLMKDKMSSNISIDKKEYNKIFNMYSKGIAGAVGIILVGVIILIQLASFQNEKAAILGTICLMFCVLIAVPIFIYLGINMENFKNNNPSIPNFYNNEELNNFNKRFAIAISLSVSLILLGVIVLILLYGLEFVSNSSVLPVVILLGFITISVPIMIYYGLQKNKYNIDMYNKINKSIKDNEDILVGKISGVIMLIATFIFLALGFIFDLWHISWMTFPLGGILCGIVGTIFSKNN